MRKKIILFGLLIFAGSMLCMADTVLDGLLKPDSISVSQDTILVVEGATFFAYSLKDHKLIKKFGKKGEGPGELKSLGVVKNIITFTPGKILAQGIDKVIIYSPRLDFVREFKKSPQFTKILPLGNNYVVIERKGERGTSQTVVNIVDEKLKVIKELFKTRAIQQTRGGKFNLEMIPDTLHLSVYNEQVFIEKSEQGFFIDVFDATGKLLYSIEKKKTDQQVTEADKKRLFAALMEDEFVKSQLQRSGGWNAIKERINLTYRATFPQIRDILVRNDKIFIQTFIAKDQKEKYLVLDLKGKTVKEVYLPIPKRPSFLTLMVGMAQRYYDINNNTYYYLVENEDEDWELRTVKIL